jgi:cytochrome c-type protein NrfB
MRAYEKNHCILLGVVIVITLISFNLDVKAEDQNMGAENIRIPAGAMAPVMLPHHFHQKVLKDCNLCHDLFPKTSGIINDLKNQQKLQKKQVMTTKCIQCHQSRKDAGESAGPVECNRCHVRN